MNQQQQWDTDRGDRRRDERRGSKEQEMYGSGGYRGRERDEFDERGFERGSYAERYGFRGEAGESESRGFRGDESRGGYESGRSSQQYGSRFGGGSDMSEPRGGYGEGRTQRGGYGSESASYGRGAFGGGSYGNEWDDSRKGSASGSGSWRRPDYGQDTSYGGGSSSPRQSGAHWGGRDDSRGWSESSGYGSMSGGSQYGGGVSERGRPYERDWNEGSRSVSESGRGGAQQWNASSSMGGTYAGGSSSASSYGTESKRGQFTGKGPKGYRRSDDRIKEDVSERLKAHGDIDASDVEVEIQNGTVTLKGEVRSRQEKRMAEDAVEGLAGVDDVINQIRVRSSSTQGDEGENGSQTIPYNTRQSGSSSSHQSQSSQAQRKGQSRTLGSSSGTADS